MQFQNQHWHPTEVKRQAASNTSKQHTFWRSWESLASHQWSSETSKNSAKRAEDGWKDRQYSTALSEESTRELPPSLSAPLTSNRDWSKSFLQARGTGQVSAGLPNPGCNNPSYSHQQFYFWLCYFYLFIYFIFAHPEIPEFLNKCVVLFFINWVDCEHKVKKKERQAIYDKVWRLWVKQLVNANCSLDGQFNCINVDWKDMWLNSYSPHSWTSQRQSSKKWSKSRPCHQKSSLYHRSRNKIAMTFGTVMGR